MLKVCGRCKKSKDLADFNKSVRGRLGLHNHCRLCQKEVKREYYLKHSEYEKAKSKIANKSEKAKAYFKQRYDSNKERLLEENRRLRSTVSARDKANKARAALILRKPEVRVAINLRSRLKLALRGKIKAATTMALVGCSREQLKRHLERQFKDGMSWDNYGKWHVDHKKPCVSFNLNIAIEQQKCFHYSNLQPLWAKDNISKGSRYDN